MFVASPGRSLYVPLEHLHPIQQYLQQTMKKPNRELFCICKYINARINAEKSFIDGTIQGTRVSMHHVKSIIIPRYVTAF